MDRSGLPTRQWLTATIVVHLVISIVHGMAHNQAEVPLSPAANLFVIVVIIVGPLAGLALMWMATRAGSWIAALAMAGSLVFGVVNHFVIAGQSQTLFGTTAVLLALTEALGFVLAVRLAQKRIGVP